MCAICGIVNFDRRPVCASDLVTMRNVMIHRGPDRGGLWTNGHEHTIYHGMEKLRSGDSWSRPGTDDLLV